MDQDTGWWADGHTSDIYFTRVAKWAIEHVHI